MTRAERNEFNYIRHSLRTIGKNPCGAQLTIRTDAGREYKQILHALYTSLGFHPASVGIDTRRFDGKERIVYIYGIRLYGKEGSAMSDFTTMEHLQERVSSYGAVLRYNDRVFITDITHTGQFRASIYEFVDEPGVDFDEIECRLFLIDTSHKTFEDAGHAIAWCLRQK